MFEELEIKGKEGTICLKPVYEMGGGTSGFFLISLSGKPCEVEISYPYYHTPDDEWRALSDYGKDEVRANGWDGFGNFENIVAKALIHLNFDKEDAHVYRNQIIPLENELKQLFKGLLETNQRQETILRNSLKKYRVAKVIVEVWDHLDEYRYCYSPLWEAPKKAT